MLKLCQLMTAILDGGCGIWQKQSDDKSTRLTSDKVYQLLVHGRWFSVASYTHKTVCHDIAKILLKVALKHNN